MIDLLKDVVGEQKLQLTIDGVHAAIDASFQKCGGRITRSETKRRMDICLHFAAEMRRDVGWSVQRIIDNMGRYLRCRLDGISWEPDNRSMWLPGDRP